MVFWTKRKVSQNIVFGMNCKIKMQQNPKIAQKTTK